MAKKAKIAKEIITPVRYAARDRHMRSPVHQSSYEDQWKPGRNRSALIDADHDI